MVAEAGVERLEQDVGDVRRAGLRLNHADVPHLPQVQIPPVGLAELFELRVIQFAQVKRLHRLVKASRLQCFVVRLGRVDFFDVRIAEMLLDERWQPRIVGLKRRGDLAGGRGDAEQLAQIDDRVVLVVNDAPLVGHLHLPPSDERLAPRDGFSQAIAQRRP